MLLVFFALKSCNWEYECEGDNVIFFVTRLRLTRFFVIVLFCNEKPFFRERLLTLQMSPSLKPPCTPALEPLRLRNPQAFCSSSRTWTLRCRWPEQRYCGLWCGEGLFWWPWERIQCLSCVNKYIYWQSQCLWRQTFFFEHCRQDVLQTTGLDLPRPHVHGHGWLWFIIKSILL
jgi:hypothetical protein